MSALGDAAAALLPPEAGGPEPERVASVARRMIARMPRTSQVGLGAALLGSLLYSLAGVVIDSALERLFPKK